MKFFINNQCRRADSYNERLCFVINAAGKLSCAKPMPPLPSPKGAYRETTSAMHWSCANVGSLMTPKLYGNNIQ